MEGLTALFAVPEGAALINRIGANHTLLGAVGERLHQGFALLSQVL